MLFTGEPGEENAQYYVCCEYDILLESKNVQGLVLDLIATYFVFNIQYPKGMRAFLLFFQHIVFSLKDDQPLPAAVAHLVTSLNSRV